MSEGSGKVESREVMAKVLLGRVSCVVGMLFGAGGIARRAQRIGPRILLILQGAQSIKCIGTGDA